MLSNRSWIKYKPFRHGLSQTLRSFGGKQQQSAISLCSSIGGSKTHTSFYKKLILWKKNPKCTVSSKVKKHYRKILTNDTNILSLVEGCTVPFHKIPQQKNIANSPKVIQEEKILVQKEIHKVLNKGAIVGIPNHFEEEFINNLFLAEKKDGENRPVINLKHLNQFIPYQHFNMEGLHCLQNILGKRG